MIFKINGNKNYIHFAVQEFLCELVSLLMKEIQFSCIHSFISMKITYREKKSYFRLPFAIFVAFSFYEFQFRCSVFFFSSKDRHA